MLEVLLSIWASFLAGLFAPLGAVCVLPLYPGFLSYLSNQMAVSNQMAAPKGVPSDTTGTSEGNQHEKIVRLGWIVTAGVVTSMAVVGFIFSFILSSSLTNAIGIISPIAFAILGVFSLFLIFNFDFSRIFPHIDSPTFKNPNYSAFAFGAFFGLIVLPCNPASLVLVFAIITTVSSFVLNFINFIFFGIGMALPLLLFSYLSRAKAGAIFSFIGNNKRRINLISGLIMLGISLYYLLFVFNILEVF